MDVAIVGKLLVLIDPPAQPGNELVEVTARACNLLEQELDEMPRVDDRAFAAAEHERTFGEPAVLDEPAEQRLVLALRGERRPVEELRDHRMMIGRIHDAHQLGPWHVEEPRT